MAQVDKTGVTKKLVKKLVVRNPAKASRARARPSELDRYVTAQTAKMIDKGLRSRDPEMRAFVRRQQLKLFLSLTRRNRRSLVGGGGAKTLK